MFDIEGGIVTISVSCLANGELDDNSFNMNNRNPKHYKCLSRKYQQNNHKKCAYLWAHHLYCKYVNKYDSGMKDGDDKERKYQRDSVLGIRLPKFVYIFPYDITIIH